MIDVIVLGGGAAGLMCAAAAASYGAEVLLLEHNDVVGKKIRISGGGRCNFTNQNVSSKNFISANPDFARSALARYTPADFVALVEQYGIRWHEKTLGQLFCDNSAQQVIDALLSECTNAGVEIRCGVSVLQVTQADAFVVHTSDGDLQARTVVVASGGLSISKLGASDIGYRIARHFDLPIVTTAPALVPLVADRKFASVFGDLAGVSVACSVRTDDAAFREALLFTHRGLSGPAILQISSYLVGDSPISIDLFPSGLPAELVQIPQADKRLVRTIVSQSLPSRLAVAWPDERFSQPRNGLSQASYQAILETMRNWSVRIVGNEGYAKAEVTRGGVDTRVLSSKTMEANSVPGLYFVGECVDVTGWLGGYNFQWAWSSGYAAGIAIRERMASAM